MKVVFTSETRNETITQDLSPAFLYVETSLYEMAEIASLKASKLLGVSPLWDWEDCEYQVVID